MFGSLYFVGDLVSTVISTPVIDYYGRKASFWAGRLGVIVCYLAMISMPISTNSIPIMYALIILLGLTQTLRRVSVYYFCEMAAKKDHPFYVAMNMAMEALTIGLTVVYFRFISKQWRWLYLGISLILGADMAIGLAWIPESPKYLYAKGRLSECSDALLKLGRFNGKIE
jgi:MFS family permease